MANCWTDTKVKISGMKTEWQQNQNKDDKTICNKNCIDVTDCPQLMMTIDHFAHVMP